MNIKVSKNDIVQMMSQKLGLSANDIEIELIGCGESTNNTEGNDPNEDNDHEDECDCDCGAELTNQTTPAELVSITKVNKVMEKALTDMGYKSRIPKNSVELCTEAMTEFMENITRKEKKIFFSFIGQKDFKAFSILWQEIQTIITKKVK